MKIPLPKKILKKKKRKARVLTVSNTIQLTPNMLRVTLHGEALASFPEDAEGNYFKLTFPGDNPDKPIMRTYTVAQYRADKNEIDVDFMLHTKPDGSTNGVAAQWATQAKQGDTMGIFGPGPARLINTHADWFLLAADMTALPALTTNLKTLPQNAKGYVVVEIIAKEDQQALTLPGGMEVIWVVNAEPGSNSSPLHKAIIELDWLPGQAAVWAACEFTTMKKIREYFKQDRKVEKSHLYVSSYWKKGLQEEDHKIAKREDESNS